MKGIKAYLSTCSILCLCFTGYCQIAIATFQIEAFSISASSIGQAVVMNSEPANVEAQFEMIVRDADGGQVLLVKTNSVTLKPGVNFLSQTPLSFERVEYGTGSRARYLKQNGFVPSGKYFYCLYVSNMSETGRIDEQCDELVSDFMMQLNLVYPADKDTIETSNPVLVWNHDEPFDQVSSNGFYRIVVCEIGDNQNPESAIIANRPVFIKDFLNSHSIQYPFDAIKLVTGKRYAWQVQKIDNTALIARTETWEFVLRPPDEIPAPMYAVVKTKPEAGAFKPVGNKLYFKFEEDYHSSGTLTYQVRDDQKKLVSMEPVNQRGNQTGSGASMKFNGDNRYEVDLNAYNLKAGYYLLELKNEKKQVFYLKFIIE